MREKKKKFSCLACLTPEQEIRIAQQQIERQARREKREPVIIPKRLNFQTKEKPFA